ncbi:fucose 4-O-acetylase-like acetyltransferase [Actinoallomurus bryophytorum]|uniref:Fucose 4-O-acetylase-like acetyltransferase n=1 Tax=Actinoallomurus bryophytorum TaxID=1490222 RepID=A0A543CMM1_9ACTN|nr:acyltransferase family protein [Actinoallomurus bryophytorum]TQL98332.1 fucose 4-O-acetylase-like acetyltransferase [Actinoallomurus bryophytorum]
MTSPSTPPTAPPDTPTPIPADASPTRSIATSPETVIEQRPARRPRDPFFDNAKFMAIVLVVAGHSIVNLRDVRIAHAAYLFVYTFHMPVFIVITGYFSRNFTFSGGKARKLITNLGVPYVVFETAYSTYHWAVGHSKFEISVLDPYYLTWFLMALFLWRLSTPVWQQIRWPVGAAVILSLLAGTTDLPKDLEMNRTFGLVPFYVLGLMLKPEHFEALKRPKARVVGAITLVLAFAFTLSVADRRMATSWVYWKAGNADMHVNNLVGSGMRLGLLVGAGILVMAFLTMVPAKRTWFTSLGGATLYAYLLHGFFTKLLEYMGWWDRPFLHTMPGVAATAVAGALLATFLCTPPVRKVMHWALEPDMSWAFVPLRRPRSV